MDSEVQGPITTGASPGDGHLGLLSSCWSEEGGFLANLYIIYCICLYGQIEAGKAKNIV